MNNRDKNIIGQILAKTYRIERFLGAGTVGTVYVARHVRSGGLYAVKVLHRKLAASPDLYQRFQDEARLIATLRHPHILPITDFDRDENGIPFFVMDLLEGENLQQRLKHKEVLPGAQAMEVIQQVGSALHTAHRSGIVHRNIKPENVFLVRHDLGDRVVESTRVMDFGLARFRRMAPAGTRDASLGVSCYMAPETLGETSTPIDGRADQWAMAVIAYRMLSGKLPWDEGNPDELLRQIVNEPPRPLPRTADLPAHTVAAISRGMSKRREDRYETMMDFVRALTARTASATNVEAAAPPPTPPATPADAAPQHRPPVPSGRVAAPAPPIPSGAVAAPPPVPAAAQAPAAAVPPAVPGSVPVVAPATPPRPAQPTPAASPAPARPPAPAGPPPVLAAPPLLIPEGTATTGPEPTRRPTMGLAIAGGALAILAGIGLTLLWEQRHRPRPLPNVPTVNTSPQGPASSLVVEPLGPPPTTVSEDAGLRGPAMPQVPVPPIRSATGEDVTHAPPAAPTGLGEAAKALGTASPAPAAPAAPAAAVPAQVMPGTSPAAPVGRPLGNAGTPQPAAPTYPTAPTAPTAAPTASAPVAPTAAVAPAPAVAPPATPSAPVAPAGPRTASRDEVDELLGTGQRPAAQPAPAPAPTAPAVAPTAKPAAPARPAARPGSDGEVAPESGEKSAEQLMEDAQAAYVRGERQRSIDLALQVTQRGTPAEATKAWRFIGSAACSVRSATLATRAYTNLTVAEHRQLLTELCKRNGLALQDGQFVAE